MKGFKIARIFGIDIEIHWTWIFIFGLIVWLFGGNYLPGAVPGQPQTLYWLFGTATALIFFASLLFHEMSHSLVAKYFKVPIERITLFIFGGVAQMKEGTKSARAEFFMAAAGPAASLVLAGLFWLLMQVGSNAFPPLASAGLYWLALINAMLAVFNLVPGFPLDGGRIFRAILWGWFKDELKATKIAAYGGKFFGILMMLGAVCLFVYTRDFLGGIWLAFIGWFLFSAAKQSYQQLVIQKILSEAKVREIMRREIPSEPEVINPEMACSSEDSLKTVYERMVRFSRKSALHFVEFDVVENGEIVGRINLECFARFLKKHK